MSDPQIQAAVAAFAAQLETLVREKALAAVIAALGGRGAAAAKPAAAPKPAPKKRGRPAKATSTPKAVAAPKASVAKKAAAPKKAAKGKRVRRSAEQIEAAAKKITEYVSKNPGSRAEHIKKGLSIPDNEWGLPIAMALDSKRLTSKGAKRSTTYWPAK